MTVTLPPQAPPGPAPARPEPMGRRSPWLAAALTFLAPGVGHVYAGRAPRGAVVAIGALLLGLGGLEASVHAPHSALRIASLAVVLGAFVGMIADGWRVARRAAPDQPRRRYQRWWVYVPLLAVVMVAGTLVQEWARSRWRSFVLVSDPMSPTVRAGDYVFTRRGIRSLSPGDVVTRLMDGGGEAVSRVVALEGDTVAMRRGVLVVNGEQEPGRTPLPDADDSPLDAGWHREHLAVDTAGYAPTLLTWGPLVVPPGHVFMVGDNRAHSLDSRHLGFFPADVITGHAEWVYFSREPLTGGIRWNRIGRDVR